MPAQGRSRWRTFSLRAFFIWVTLVSVIVGYLLTKVQPMVRQWEAVDRFVEQGAEIETRPSELSDLIKRFLPEDRNSDITMIKLNGCQGDISETMKGLRHLPHLERLYLTNLKLEDEDIADISQLVKLRRLALWCNKLTDASAASLASLPNLEVVDIQRNDMTWHTLREFQDRPDIVIFDDEIVANCADLEAIAQLTIAKLNFRFRHLTLQDYSPGMVAKVFQTHPFEGYPRLKELTLQDWENFNASDFHEVLEATHQFRRTIRFKGDTSPESPGWSNAIQIFRPDRVQIRTINQRHYISFAQGKGEIELSTSGNSSDLQLADLFQETTQLKFDKCDVKDLGFLSGAKKLKTIQIEGCPHLTEISGLPGPLGSIRVRHCSSLKCFSCWDNLHLRELSLGNCPQLDRFENARKFASLQKIKLTRLPKLNSLAPLKGLDDLEQLKLANVDPALSLSSLPVLKKLKEISFDYSKSLKNLDGMPKLPALRRVSLDYCRNLEQISGLRVNNSLEELILDNTTSLKSLEGLEGQTQLRQLKVDSNEKMVDLAGLNGLKNLERLELECCSALTNVGKQVHLPNLKTLNFSRCTRLTDLSGLNAPKLTVLKINGSVVGNAFSDLEKLPPFENLDLLSLDNCPSISSFQPLAEKNITRLEISDISKESKSLDFSPFRKVKELNVYGYDLNQIEGLEKLTQLRTLKLRGDKDHRFDVNLLPLPPNLEALDLSYDQSPSLEILERLPRLRRLKLNLCEIGKLDCGNQIESLYLWYCTELLSSNHSSCTGLGKLTELDLELGCGKDAPTDLSFLSLAPKLRVLRIWTFQTLAPFDFLKELKRLEVLSVTWCYDEYGWTKPPIPSDISAIENCQQLQTLILDQSGCHGPHGVLGIKAIAGLTQMRSLWLDRFHEPNLELMRKMDNLEVLSVAGYNKNFTSIRGIENKAKLRSLNIEGIRNADADDHSSILKTLPAYDPKDKSWQLLTQ